MDLWSVIPIGVHHYTILSTMVSSISLGNILWKDTTCKNLLGKESYIVISFHHSILQLAYITQAWIFWILELVLCKQTYEMHIQMHHTSSWACSPTCVLKILIGPFHLSYLSPYVKISPFFVIDDNPYTKVWIKIQLNPCCLPKHIYHVKRIWTSFMNSIW